MFCSTLLCSALFCSVLLCSALFCYVCMYSVYSPLHYYSPPMQSIDRSDSDICVLSSPQVSYLNTKLPNIIMISSLLPLLRDYLGRYSLIFRSNWPTPPWAGIPCPRPAHEAYRCTNPLRGWRPWPLGCGDRSPTRWLCLEVSPKRSVSGGLCKRRKGQKKSRRGGKRWGELRMYRFNDSKIRLSWLIGAAGETYSKWSRWPFCTFSC